MLLTADKDFGELVFRLLAERYRAGVGSAGTARPWHVAWLEPDTGVLTGIRPGQVKITVTVNGVMSSADVRVSP